MSDSSEFAPLPACWDYYRRLAERADAAPLDDLGWGREEQLNETLFAIERGNQFEASRTKSLDGLPMNRAKKHRRLRSEGRVAATFRTKAGASHVQGCFDRAEVSEVRRLLAPEEFEIEHRLAHGETYQAIASTLNSSASALKMRSMRWRQKFRRKQSA